MAIEKVTLIEHCCRLVEQKLEWGPSREWVNSDYKKLSEKIYEKTNVLISTATLKRFFGKIRTHDRYNPQEETKKALALFLGFQSWDDFKADAVPHEIHQEEPKDQHMPLHRMTYKRVVPIAGLVCLLIIGLAFSIYKINLSQQPQVSFIPKKTMGFAPYTAVFDYDVAASEPKSAYVTFGYNGVGTNKFELPPEQNTITHWYSMPGYYPVKFYVKDKLAYQSAVHVINEHWETEWMSSDRSMHKMLEKRLLPGGILTTEASGYQKYNTDLDQRCWIRHSLVREYELDGDYFTFETKLKVIPVNDPTTCDDVQIKLQCENNNLQLHFLRPGCTRWANLEFSEVSLNGEFKDLSIFCQNLRVWNTIRLEVKGHRAQVYFNDKKLYTIPYEQKLGALKGIMIETLGNNYLDYVKLWDRHQNLVYVEEFDSLTSQLSKHSIAAPSN